MRKARTDSEIRLSSAIENFLSRLDSLDVAEQTNYLSLLEKNVMTSFRGRIDRLNDGLNPSEISIDTLPQELRELWVSPQGKFRLEMTPREDLSDNHFLRAFVEEIQSVIDDNATGTAVINVGAAEAVQSAFIQAFSYALILIAILLWLILRSVKEVIVTLISVVVSRINHLRRGSPV